MKSSSSITRFILILAFLIFPFFKGMSQDIHFSQFFLAPLYQNPAMAGAENGLEGTMNYRTQWRSITVPFKTYAATVHGRFIKKRSQKNFFAGGVNFFYDEAGDGLLKTTSIILTGAYHVRINKTHKIGAGFSGGYGQRRIDFGNFEWGSQYIDGVFNGSASTGESIMNPTFSYLDFSTGVVWSFDNQAGRLNVTGNNFMRGHAGVSFSHFNRPEYSFNDTGERLYTKLVAHGNFLLSVPGSKFAVNPGFLFYRQGPNRQFLIGSMFRYDLMPESKYTGQFKGAGAYFGAYVRAGDAIVLSSMLEFSNYAIGFSYDANLSNLRPATNGRGGFEVSLRIIGSGSFFSRTMNTR